MKTSSRLGAVLLAAIIASCTEPFPPYSEPQNVLRAELTIQAPDTVLLYYDLLSHLYFLGSPLSVNLNVINMQDDLLQGTAYVDGRIVLQTFGDFPRTIVIPITKSLLRSPPIFQGNIAIGPGRKAEFSTLWVPFEAIRDVPYTVVPEGLLYGPIPFIANAEVQIFERVPPIRASAIEFSLTFLVKEV